MTTKERAKRELSLAALEVLEFAVDNDAWIVTETLNNGQRPHFDLRNPAVRGEPTTTGKGGEEAPFSLYERPEVPHITAQMLDALRRRGFVQTLDKNKLCDARGLPKGEGGVGGYFAWYEFPWGVTKAGRAHLEANRERLAQKRRAQAETPEELVVAKAERSPWPRVGTLCRVIRRTDRRVYVEVVEQSGAQASWHGLVRGSGRNRYIEVGDVLAEGVTREAYARMVQADKEFREAMQQARSQMEAEIEPIKKRYHDRAWQLQAKFEDELREAIGQPGTPRP